MKLPTCSELDRVKVCPASHVLPHSDSIGEWSQRGDAAHTYLLSADRQSALLPPEHREFVESIQDEQIPMGSYEFSFAINPDTGEAKSLGRIEGDYLLADVSQEKSICGTADIFKVNAESVYIGDLKTGISLHTPPAHDNMQVRTLALAAARVERVSHARVELLKVLETGHVAKDGHSLDAAALDAVETELREIVRRVREAEAIRQAGGRLSVVSGPHCRYCPAFSFCPEKTQLVRLMAGDGKELTAQILDALTPETAAKAYYAFTSAKALLARIGDALAEYGRQNPFDIGNGWIFGETQTSRRKLDGAQAYRWLVQTMGVEAADKATEVTTTQAAIDRTLREFVPKGGRSDIKKALMDFLAKNNGIKVVTSTSVRPHRKSDQITDGSDE